ncbi:MAG: GNAT family N-acetyltransferase [Acidiferrobacter sp.]
MPEQGKDSPEKPCDPPSQIDVRLLGEAEMALTLPLIQQLNPALSPTILAQRLQDMLARGYQCAGAFENGRCIGVVGIWFGTRFWCGRYVDIDNLIVNEVHRAQGMGQRLIEWVEAYARQQGCEIAVLDAYVTNDRAHTFYLRHRYRIVGFHFSKNLGPQP